MTQTVTVTQASIADLIEQRDALLEALRAMVAWANGAPGGYPGTEAATAIAKASPIAGLTEIGGCDEQ